MNISRALRLLTLAATLTLGAGGAVSANAAHTPVTLCHWVPAHGGSYVVITVDDSGATANPAGAGHMGHADDIIPANPDGTCGIID
jgi:hypothetical protein